MDLPVNQVQQILQDHVNSYPRYFSDEIYGVYVNSLPGTQYFENQTATNMYNHENGSAGVILVRESSNEPGNYANNVPKDQLLGVEVQIFFNEQAKDVQRTELQVQNLLIDNGWRLTTSRPHTWDPDTNWLTKTMFFEKTETLTKEDYQKSPW